MSHRQPASPGPSWSVLEVTPSPSPASSLHGAGIMFDEVQRIPKKRKAAEGDPNLSAKRPSKKRSRTEANRRATINNTVDAEPRNATSSARQSTHSKPASISHTQPKAQRRPPQRNATPGPSSQPNPHGRNTRSSAAVSTSRKRAHSPSSGERPIAPSWDRSVASSTSGTTEPVSIGGNAKSSKKSTKRPSPKKKQKKSTLAITEVIELFSSSEEESREKIGRSARITRQTKGPLIAPEIIDLCSDEDDVPSSIKPPSTCTQVKDDVATIISSDDEELQSKAKPDAARAELCSPLLPNLRSPQRRRVVPATKGTSGEGRSGGSMDRIITLANDKDCVSPAAVAELPVAQAKSLSASTAHTIIQHLDTDSYSHLPKEGEATPDGIVSKESITSGIESVPARANLGVNPIPLPPPPEIDDDNDDAISRQLLDTAVPDSMLKMGIRGVMPGDTREEKNREKTGPFQLSPEPTSPMSTDILPTQPLVSIELDTPSMSTNSIIAASPSSAPMMIGSLFLEANHGNGNDAESQDVIFGSPVGKERGACSSTVPTTRTTSTPDGSHLLQIGADEENQKSTDDINETPTATRQKTPLFNPWDSDDEDKGPGTLSVPHAWSSKSDSSAEGYIQPVPITPNFTAPRQAVVLRGNVSLQTEPRSPQSISPMKDTHPRPQLTPSSNTSTISNGDGNVGIQRTTHEPPTPTPMNDMEATTLPSAPIPPADLVPNNELGLANNGVPITLLQDDLSTTAPSYIHTKDDDSNNGMTPAVISESGIKGRNVDVDGAMPVTPSMENSAIPAIGTLTDTTRPSQNTLGGDKNAPNFEKLPPTIDNYAPSPENYGLEVVYAEELSRCLHNSKPIEISNKLHHPITYSLDPGTVHPRLHTPHFFAQSYLPPKRQPEVEKIKPEPDDDKLGPIQSPDSSPSFPLRPLDTFEESSASNPPTHEEAQRPLQLEPTEDMTLHAVVIKALSDDPRLAAAPVESNMFMSIPKETHSSTSLAREGTTHMELGRQPDDIVSWSDSTTTLGISPSPPRTPAKGTPFDYNLFFIRSSSPVDLTPDVLDVMTKMAELPFGEDDDADLLSTHSFSYPDV